MNGMLLSWASLFALLCIAVAMLLATLRLLKGPAAQDRVLALDTMYICGMLMLLVLGIRVGSTEYFEGAVTIALLGFVSSVALAKFLLRGEVIE
ncbi:Na(+)/H(+) antiporter subunit F [Pigmentiphaga humi]|uniref:Na(+)/H(+) antiporter subunit F n=1 Tax=Pigmentiphaga humi TaxID=2478468 RepID=A0A3P4B1V9_9BURK|nr:K+/H+ antiporter subunit F [Pigmentiphaga humi]VCU69680.1 Na(+)/H(+) antiporter subunit F [Pigmentiphaga humi]